MFINIRIYSDFMEKARILSFRRGRHTQRTNQFLLEVDGVDSKEKASVLIGTRLVWKSPADKEITGKITAVHGRNGVLRARFTKGLPGTAIGKSVEMLKKEAVKA